VLLRNRGPFPASHVRLMSSSAGAGREHGQAASPTEIFRTTDIVLHVNGGWPGGKNLFSMSSNFFRRSVKSTSSATTARGLTANQSSGGEKKSYCV